MEEAENCAEQIIGSGLGKPLPDKKTLNAAMQDGKPYVLPSWRMNEIIQLAAETLSEQEYYKDNFDYKKMILEMGIKLKKYSSFSPENLEKFTEISLSLWNEGVCLVFPDEETGEQNRMIAYNDKKSSSECMHIIFHELAHIIMKHTQQSINGEVEATCFALVMSVFVMLEQKFHFSKRLVKTAGKPLFMQGLKEAFQPKEAS